jgi:hypothetical protein
MNFVFPQVKQLRCNTYGLNEWHGQDKDYKLYKCSVEENWLRDISNLQHQYLQGRYQRKKKVLY